MAGIKRILMGYAMGENSEELVQGIFPYSHIPESQWELFDRLVLFIEKLTDFLAIVNRQNNLEEWSWIMSSLVDDFLDIPDHYDPDCILIKRACGALTEMMKTTGFTENVPISVAFAEIKDGLEATPKSSRFMAGGVTFCRLLPMRNVPFRVVYLMGMNEGVFPRLDSSPSFNLMTQYPRKGDRSRRGDDRQIFFEALLSARQYVIISYVGWHSGDNSELPPSVVVGELMDYLVCKEGDRYIDHSESQQKDIHLKSYSWLIQHRLHAHHPDYFQQNRKLFSFSQAGFKGAVKKANGFRSLTQLIQSDVSEPSDRDRTITVTDFCRVLENPARGFLRQRCRLNLDSSSYSVSEREPFELMGLTGYQVKNDILRRLCMPGIKVRDWLEIYQATGWVPQGEIGVQQFRTLERTINEFVFTDQSLSILYL
jgi:exodeoxyribonuclease V gamma subunit